jgi:hypothetical protein
MHAPDRCNSGHAHRIVQTRKVVKVETTEQVIGSKFYERLRHATLAELIQGESGRRHVRDGFTIMLAAILSGYCNKEERDAILLFLGHYVASAAKRPPELNVIDGGAA